ncbi:MAG TPA: sulfate permease [Pyrinomonadaceae bacterium]|jgi:SulP family sulfate permease|nr:sulfate permease [Pyrinomonadaceae bacterium]
MHKVLEPKILAVLREGYSRKQFYSDLAAGTTVGIVALPLAIAFAIASGVKPEQGLFTAIVAGFIISLLGGSRAQISGPTGAFVVIIYGIVRQHGYDGLAVATLIAGILLILMGLFRMGALLKFIPYPVTVGFTTGIALIIFSSQLGDFLGLQLEAPPAGFLERLIAYRHHLSEASAYALGVGLLSLVVIAVWPRITHRVPGMLIAIILSTVAVKVFHLPVSTIGSRFGAVPNHLPLPHIPLMSLSLIKEMFSPAVTIAFLAALESLLAAVVADGMLGTRHRSNMELVAQGAGNIGSVLFGGIPATGAIARTATNIKTGGRTPIAGMIHAVVLLLILLFFGKYAALIPMPALAAILIVVAYNMSEWVEFKDLLRGPKSDAVILLATFLLTVFIDLTVAIQVGVLLATFLFMKRMSDATQVTQVTETLSDQDETEARDISKLTVPKGVEVFEIYGSLFFGAIERFKDAMRSVKERPRVLILRMRHVQTIDASGLHSLKELLEATRRGSIVLIISAVRADVRQLMERDGFAQSLGDENFCEDIFGALDRSKEILAGGDSRGT